MIDWIELMWVGLGMFGVAFPVALWGAFSPKARQGREDERLAVLESERRARVEATGDGRPSA